MNTDIFEISKRFRLLLKHKKLVGYILLTAFVLVTLYNIFSTKLYKSETTIVPIESSRRDVLSALGDQSLIGSLAGLVQGFSASSDKLMHILESRTITENVINRLNLMPLLFPSKWDEKQNRWKNPEKEPFMEEAVEEIQNNYLRVETTKKGIIQISVVWDDPELAAKIARLYLIELQNFLYSNSLSMGKKNRVFLEEQLEKNKLALVNAENQLKEFQEKHKIISLDAQAEMTVKTIANLKAELLSRDYQLGFLENTTGLNTAEARRIIEEKRELSKQLQKVESGQQVKTRQKSSSMISVRDFPSIELEYLRLKREFLILEQVFGLLTTQYELAKIEEFRDQVAFEVIDEAKIPMRKYKPKILLNTAVAFFVSFILALFAVSAKESLDWKELKEQFISKDITV